MILVLDLDLLSWHEGTDLLGQERLARLTGLRIRLLELKVLRIQEKRLDLITYLFIGLFRNVDDGFVWIQEPTARRRHAKNWAWLMVGEHRLAAALTIIHLKYSLGIVE